MARKLPGLQRVIETPSLAAVAYGEIASSLFFALGIVALDALGLTPWVLLAVGSLFVLVALSYAEGTAALPETGGAATFVRRAFNDQLGFLTDWAIFLDYVIVIALAALFVPHYLGNAVCWNALTTSPTDLFVGIASLAAEPRAPGPTRPRSLFVGTGGAVVVSFLLALVARSAYPADPETKLGTRWLRAPLVGVADAFTGHLPDGVVDILRVFMGL